MERTMTDYFTERTTKSSRSWLPQNKIYNSFSHSPSETKMTNSSIFSRGELNQQIESAKIIL